MDNLGELLKTAREAKNLTLDQVSEDTKVRKVYLKALEENDFKEIPGEVFVKGTIRTYGNYLEMDGVKLVEQYKAMRSGLPEEEVRPETIRETTDVKVFPSFKRHDDIGSGTASRKPLILGALLTAIIILLAAGGIYYYLGHRTKAPAPLPAKVADTAAPAAKAGTKAPEAAKAAVPAGTVSLELEAVGDCWTYVWEEGGRELYSGTLHKGDKKSFTSKKKIKATYGNIFDMRITYNGKLLPVEKPGQPVDRTYVPEGKE